MEGKAEVPAEADRVILGKGIQFSARSERVNRERQAEGGDHLGTRQKRGSLALWRCSSVLSIYGKFRTASEARHVGDN